MKPPFPYWDTGLFFVFLCTVCFRTVPFPLVVLSVFKTTVDVTSRILSVAPWYPSRTIRPGRHWHLYTVAGGMADGKKGKGGKEDIQKVLFPLPGGRGNRRKFILKIG